MNEGGMIMEPESVVDAAKPAVAVGHAGMLSTLLQYYDAQRDDGLPMDSHGHRACFFALSFCTREHC